MTNNKKSELRSLIEKFENKKDIKNKPKELSIKPKFLIEFIDLLKKNKTNYEYKKNINIDKDIHNVISLISNHYSIYISVLISNILEQFILKHIEEIKEIKKSQQNKYF